MTTVARGATVVDRRPACGYTRSQGKCPAGPEVTMSAIAQPIPTPTPEGDADIPDVPIYRLSVEQYHAMARAGILDEDAPAELLEGWLVQKMTKYPAHRVATHRVRRALERLVAVGWYVDSQEPITLPDSEPEPDVVVV